MPYKGAKKRLAYARRWRRAHPNYMRDYARRLNRRSTVSEIVRKIEAKLSAQS